MHTAVADAAPARRRRQLSPAQQLRLLVRNHFESLLGAGSDSIPVMLFEQRSLTRPQRTALARLQGAYESDWEPVLRALHDLTDAALALFLAENR